MALIAIDGDGPLLDYNKQFGALWEQYFGVKLQCQDPTAYHAARYWGIEPPERGHAFWEYFDQHGWRDMPAAEGAVEACKALVRHGHELVCVTSIPPHRDLDRLHNLRMHEFPIDRVIATGHAPFPGANPKQAAIKALAPDWFVDDELRKLKDLEGVRCVLLDPGHSDSPNAGQPNEYLAMTVASMVEFADRFLVFPSFGKQASMR